jgi:uncharacterized membrane protein YheB (UPF0754 family)
VDEYIAQGIKQQTPELLDKLGKKINEPEIKKELLAGIMKGVDHFIDSLGSVGAMARGFIDIENLQSVLDSYLDEKEKDICGWLQKREVREHVEDVFNGWIDDLFSQPVSAVFNEINDDKTKQFCDYLAELLLQTLLKSDQDKLAELIKDSAEIWLVNEAISFNKVSGKFLGDKSTQSITERVADKIITFIKSQGSISSVPVITDKAVDTLLQKPVGKLGRIIPSSVHRGLADYVVLTVNRVFLREVPGLVKSLQFNQLVTEKINSLDLLKLERLLLSIMEEQFKYINLFGALLGFIIGCFNLILLRLV